MSSSELAAAPAPASFLVTSDPTVQITVYDSTRTLRGQAEGSLRLQLIPGLYRVHFERCGRVHHEIVDHEADTNLSHAGPALHSPVPFAGAATSHNYYTAPAQELSVADTAPPLGPGPHDSRLFVFMRRAARDGSPRQLPSEPVTLHDADGRELTAITHANAELDHDAGYAAYSCRATPGTYRLRAARSQRDAAIVVPAGRAAQVFVADTGSLRLAELRMALVPVGDRFNPRSLIWGAMENVIAALRVPDRTLPLAARSLLPAAVEDNLCFGIAAAHLLWRSGDRPGLAAVMRHLVRYREIPDVAILGQLDGGSAWAYQPLRRSPLALPDTPPLLRTSLTLAMTRPELDPGTLSAYSALAHAARTAVHDSVWCIWSTRSWDARWIEPAIERLREHDRQRDALSIARSLALPTETVEQALEAIAATAPSVFGKPLDAGDLNVPGYALDKLLGRGPRSTVYRATHQAGEHAVYRESWPPDEREVALKIVPVLGGVDGCARAHGELDRCPSIDHPQLLAASARGTLPGDTGIWLETELCTGSVLDLLSEEDAPLALPEAHRLMLDTLTVLAHLHERGIAHGDLKLSNLLLRSDRSVAIAGPELAVRRAIPAELRHATDAPRLTPPELLRSDEPPTPASDVWAVAAMYYFLLTLEYPRDEYADQSQLEAVLDNPIVSITRRRPDLPLELARQIDAALSPIRETRPQNAGAFRELLAAIDMAAPAKAGDDVPGRGIEDGDTARLLAYASTRADHVALPRGDGTMARKRRPIRSLLTAAHKFRGRVSIAMAAGTATIIGLLVWSITHPSIYSCEQDPQFGNLRHRSAACLASYQHTGNVRDLALAADAYLTLGELDSAGKLADQLFADSQPGDGYAIRSQIALKQNHATDALRYAVLASAVHSVSGTRQDLVDDALLRARASGQLSDLGAALKAADGALAIALELRDSHAEVTGYLARADALREIGDVRAANDAVNMAIERSTEPCDWAQADLRRAQCLADLGEREPSMFQLSAVARNNTRCGDRSIDESVTLNEAWLLRERDPAAASVKLDALVLSAGEHPEVLLLRSYLATDRGDLAAAEHHLNRAEQSAHDAPDWLWRVDQARAELSELRGGVLDDTLAEYYYRRAIGAIATLRATVRTHSAYFVSSHRGPYDGLIALLARQSRWRDALSVVLDLDASDMLRSAANEHDALDQGWPDSSKMSSSAIMPTRPRVDDVLSAWRSRDLVIVIASSRRQIGSGHERAYRLRISQGQVTGEDVGDSMLAQRLAEKLYKEPGDRAAAISLGSVVIPAGSEASTLHVLAIGALSRTPLPALRNAAGSLIIAQRPVARVLALTATRPESRGGGRPVIIADPRGDLPGAAAEGATVARAVGPGALLAGSGTGIAATRALLWTAVDAELLHIAGHIAVLQPSPELPLAYGKVGAVDFLQHGLAPRIAVLSGDGSATARDEEGWGSFAAALLESGTQVVVATDRAVHDNAALSMMRNFYAQPDWRTDPERALARVQVALDLRTDTSADGASSPQTWAAFKVLRRPPVIR